MITITDAQRNSLQITKKGTVLVRLFYGDGTSYIAIASQPALPGWTDNIYRPMLLSSPVTSSSVDMFTHKFKASELRLEISNGDYHPRVKFSDLVTDSSLGADNDWGFENRTCEIRLQTQGVATWNNSIQLFKGVVRDIVHTATQVTFSVQDEREIIHSEIGVLIQDTDAADTAQGLPDNSIGKVKPIIYGVHISNVGDDSKALDVISTVTDFVPCLYLGIDSSDKHLWFVANHKIDEINNDSDDADQQQIWGFDSNIDRFVRLSTEFTVEQNDSNGCIISHPNNPDYLDMWFGKGAVTVNQGGTGSHTNFANPVRISDKDFTTNATGILDGPASVNDFIDADIPFPAYDNQAISDDDIDKVRILVYIKATPAGGANSGNYAIDFQEAETLPDPEGASYPDLRISSGTGLSPTLLSIAETVTLRVLCTVIMLGGEDVTIDVYEIYKQIKYRTNKIIPLYFGGTAREYTFTRGGHDEASTGALIENPAGVIEDVYLNELGRIAVDIDTSNFDTSSNTLTSWKFSFYLNKLTNSLKLIQDLVRSCRSFVWLKPDGTVTMKTINDTYTSSDRKINFKQTINPQFSRTTPQNQFTAVNILYGDNGKGASNVDTGISQDNTMQTKYNLTEAQSTLNFRTKYISDSATATNLRSYLLAQWKQLHNIISFGTGLEYIDLDIGDIIEFTNVPFKVFGEDITGDVTRAGQIIYKYWWIFDVKRSSTGIKIKAFQLHDLG